MERGLIVFVFHTCHPPRERATLLRPRRSRRHAFMSAGAFYVCISCWASQPPASCCEPLASKDVAWHRTTALAVAPDPAGAWRAPLSRGCSGRYRVWVLLGPVVGACALQDVEGQLRQRQRHARAPQRPRGYSPRRGLESCTMPLGAWRVGLRWQGVRVRLRLAVAGARQSVPWRKRIAPPWRMLAALPNSISRRSPRRRKRSRKRGAKCSKPQPAGCPLLNL